MLVLRDKPTSLARYLLLQCEQDQTLGVNSMGNIASPLNSYKKHLEFAYLCNDYATVRKTVS